MNRGFPADCTLFIMAFQEEILRKFEDKVELGERVEKERKKRSNFHGTYRQRSSPSKMGKSKSRVLDDSDEEEVDKDKKDDEEDKDDEDNDACGSRSAKSSGFHCAALTSWKSTNSHSTIKAAAASEARKTSARKKASGKAFSSSLLGESGEGKKQKELEPGSGEEEPPKNKSKAASKDNMLARLKKQMKTVKAGKGCPSDPPTSRSKARPLCKGLATPPAKES
ncbi:hypothetical protein C8R45DRAFT_947992 [Mycena sanguinolenta]|nr:hypothetical protein C8R45DRAFT_947992 [Mycena sanguinolenta]